MFWNLLKIISPAIALILLMKSCQDNNVGVDTENHLDVYLFFSSLLLVQLLVQLNTSMEL